MKKTATECFFPYNPKWHKSFVEEKNKILKDFPGEGIRIEHIGSTSIVGMKGIPIIDIMIRLLNFDKDIEDIKSILKDNKYKEIEIFKERHFLIKENDEYKRLFTVLVVKIKSKLWEQNMHQKILLSTSEEARKDYIELKIKGLAKSEGGLKQDHCPDKDYFLEKE